MSIQIDWQIIDEDEPLEPQAALPAPRSRAHPPRWLWPVVVGVIAIAAAGTACLGWLLRARLNTVEAPVRAVAQLEAQAIAANDRTSYMAFQDQDSYEWRALQRNRFGRLEQVGLPEFGWLAANTPPRIERMSLEPDRTRLDIVHQFSVTQPLPCGSTTIALRVPQFYRQTPYGWVHTTPSPEFWGAWRKQAGHRVIMVYYQRDAEWVEPLIPRLDEIMDRVCDGLACPALLPITFENTLDSLAYLVNFSYGYDNTGLKLPSPHLIGLPADAPSREEFARAIGTRLVQALVYQASYRRLNMSYLVSQQIVHWELARVGLAGPLVNQTLTPSLKLALQPEVWQPLSLIPLRVRPLGTNVSPQESLTPLALTFIEERLGTRTVPRLIPALATSYTLGEAIYKTLDVNPSTLETAWRTYAQDYAASVTTDAWGMLLMSKVTAGGTAQ